MDLVASCKDKLAYFRIKELKAVLTQLGLSKRGKKQDLVDRILTALSDGRVSGMCAKNNAVGKDDVAKLVDDTYRKMQVSRATDLASKSQRASESSNVKLKEETADSYRTEKIRCPCGSPLPNERMIKRRGAGRGQKWMEKPNSNSPSSSSTAIEGGAYIGAVEAVTDRFNSLAISQNDGWSNVPAPAQHFGSIGLANRNPVQGQTAFWKPKSYGTTSGLTAVEVEKGSAAEVAGQIRGNEAHMASSGANSAVLSKLVKGNLVENFTVDNSTYSHAQIRATFYPKFENEESDHEIRVRMIEMVSKGLATMEVSLKHSGSLFMYAGLEGGAYAKNSFGNVYTAVGVFVLGRTFREAWGAQAANKQAEFNKFLGELHVHINGTGNCCTWRPWQRPREDYVVVTAVTELGIGRPKFYSTPEIIAFCRKWRLPTNHVWLFSTRKSVTSFFAAYDALCEEGTATTVCRALDEVADISVPGSKDHMKVQGEILEGLVARIVSHESLKHMEQVLRDFPLSPIEEDGKDLGPSLREICAANRSDEKQQIKSLLQSVGTSFCPNYLDWFGNEGSDPHSRNADRSVLTKFLQAHPADSSTAKLQEMIRLMREKRYPAAFKLYHNYHEINFISSDNLHFKMVIHVHSDSAFRRYQKEMRYKPGLWPLYRGFFVDLNLFKADKEKAIETARTGKDVKNGDDNNSTFAKDSLADEDANLMIKLNFLTYKLRTFLIRNGLSILFKEGPSAYKAYYLRQMKIWNTSPAKQRELSKMLDEWAVYIHRKYGHKMLSSSVYLSEAEPFLEQYAKCSPQNQALIGSAGNLVRAEDFLAILEGGREEEGELEPERDAGPVTAVKDTVAKDEGLIIFFPGIPGCAKSALCKEILNAPGSLEDERPVNSLMGDLIKGRYWQKVADECRRKPYSIMLADKNAPDEGVWRQIEDMCRTTKASAVPVVPDSEGTETNPFSLDAELIEHFGSLVKMPLLKSDRSSLPDSVKSVLEEGINLYKLHTNRHGRWESTKGTYAKEWANWEKQLRDILQSKAEYLISVQVPFEFAVKSVLEQLRAVAKGEYMAPIIEKRKLATIVFAAVSLPVAEIHGLLHSLSDKDPMIEAFFKDKNLKDSLTKAHVTLAHKRSHGVTAVASYGSFLHEKVPVDITALLFSEKLAALEAHPGLVNGEKITSKNQRPHVTLWTGEGVAAKEANALPRLFLEGKATRIEIDPPISITGILQFY